ncbi:MAG: adenylate/guanylate cyclase domain-containing protein, partial [Anaerolineae bacterium]
MTEREQLEQAIIQLEAQRAALGDAVADASIAALRAELATLEQGLPPEQRKQATVLVADVSGFTAMSETLDAEEVAAMMNALWRRLDVVIVEHGGHIDKHTGDGLVALWGVDAAREDDPERAVHAALAMQAVVGDFGTGHTIGMRVGLGTGPVLLGTVATTGEFSAIGDAVDVAHALEAAAPGGGVLVSRDTYRHVRGLFDVEGHGPVPVTGGVRPVQTYLVRHARPHPFRLLARGVAGIQTRTIGRDAELLMLKNAFRDATEDAEPRVVTIVGDAGVGKSRLLYEFEKWVQRLPAETRFLRGRAAPETEAIPFGLIRRTFAESFGILESDGTDAVREKFRVG